MSAVWARDGGWSGFACGHCGRGAAYETGRFAGEPDVLVCTRCQVVLVRRTWGVRPPQVGEPRQDVGRDEAVGANGPADVGTDVVSAWLSGAAEMRRNWPIGPKRPRGRPRKMYTDEWVTLGISKAQYYRRKKAGTL